MGETVGSRFFQSIRSPELRQLLAQHNGGRIRNSPSLWDDYKFPTGVEFGVSVFNLSTQALQGSHECRGLKQPRDFQFFFPARRLRRARPGTIAGEAAAGESESKRIAAAGWLSVSD